MAREDNPDVLSDDAFEPADAYLMDDGVGDTASLIATFGAAVTSSLLSLYHLSEMICTQLREPATARPHPAGCTCLADALARSVEESPPDRSLTLLLDDARRHAHDLRVTLAHSLALTRERLLPDGDHPGFDTPR